VQTRLILSNNPRLQLYYKFKNVKKSDCDMSVGPYILCCSNIVENHPCVSKTVKPYMQKQGSRI
jgi:hypothetical protein